MKKFYRISSLVLALILGVLSFTGCGSKPTLASIKSAGKIIMLTNASFPPFEYTSGSEVVGIDVDIANEIAKDIGVKLEIQDMEFAGIISAIKSGKGAMGVSGMSVTDERKKSVDFSDPYYTSKIVILVSATETAITDADSLKGKKIGVQTGTTSDDKASAVENAEISRYSSFLDAATALKSGKVNAVIVDEGTANEIVAKNKDLKILDKPFEDESYAICVQKGNKELLDSINATIKKLKDAGTIDQFTKKHSSSANAATTTAAGATTTAAGATTTKAAAGATTTAAGATTTKAAAGATTTALSSKATSAGAATTTKAAGATTTAAGATTTKAATTTAAGATTTKPTTTVPATTTTKKG